LLFVLRFISYFSDRQAERLLRLYTTHGHDIGKSDAILDQKLCIRECNVYFQYSKIIMLVEYEPGSFRWVWLGKKGNIEKVSNKKYPMSKA
jgi:hypothetical protein